MGLGKSVFWLGNGYRFTIAAAISMGISALALGAGASAARADEADRSPSQATDGGAAVSDEGRALDVKGQNRRWNRLMGMKGKKDFVDFVKLRRDYRDEIERTSF